MAWVKGALQTEVASDEAPNGMEQQLAILCCTCPCEGLHVAARWKAGLGAVALGICAAGTGSGGLAFDYEPSADIKALMCPLDAWIHGTEL